jgi:TolB protein
VRGAGDAVRRLTRNRVFDGFPSWSPDRKRIVFVRSVAENDADVWIMNTDGTGARRLAGSARGAQDLYPAFSPDGRWIVFASDRGGREPDLYVMRADGKKLRRLVAGPKFVVDTQPRFSPDGRHVVFTSNRVSFFNHEIYRVRFSDGGGLQRLTYWGTGKDGAPGDDVSPSYSPDGKRIAFVSDRNGGYAIWTMDANGGDLREVSRHPGHNVVFPRFSPDGRSLVYTSFRDAQGRHPDVLWTVGADGSGRRSLGLGHAADW